MDLSSMLEKLATEGASAAAKAKADKAALRAKSRQALKASILTTPVVFNTVSKLNSNRWKNEALVMILSEGTCKCGERYSYPHQRLFIRRQHMKDNSLHWEPLGHRPIVTSLPFQIEHDTHNLEACPKCFTQADADGATAQMFLALSNEPTPSVGQPTTATVREIKNANAR